MFVSTYESGIDAKGRVSIPASFRAALGGGSRVFLWPSLDGSGCLEGGGEALMQLYRQTISRLPLQSPARKALVNGVFARAADLKMDEPGRIRLPDELMAAAGITDRVVFAGNIDSFQIWNPDAHAAFDAAMASEAAKPETLNMLADPYNQAMASGALSGLSLVRGEE